MKNTSTSPSISSFAITCVVLALILSGCGGEEEAPANNASSDEQTCAGKCDSTDPAAGFRPLVRLYLIDDESNSDVAPSDGDAADAGTADAGFSGDTGLTDVGAGDAGLGDAGLGDAGLGDAGSSDAGSSDAGTSDAGAGDAGSSDTGLGDTASQSFRIRAALADEHRDEIDQELALSAKIWATRGEPSARETLSTEPHLSAELTLMTDATDADPIVFSSERLDLTELSGWDMLTVQVSGDIGDEAFEQNFEFPAGEDEGTEVFVDPYAAARDVDLAVIDLDPELAAPDYPYPGTHGPFALSGTEFWQKWPGGHNPTYSYSEGTEAGRKCMSASAIRFEAVMAEPPAELVELEENSNWSGRFFNWNDDFSHQDSTGRPNGAVLWAWRTHLIKWISQTGDDGRCHLPTRGLVERAAASCLRHAEQNDGDIEGCQAY